MKSLTKLAIACVAIAMLPLSASVASAQEESPQECAPAETIDKYRLLRQLSLDIRGRIPTHEEYAALHGVDEIPQETIDDMIRSDEHSREIREYHRKIIWGSLNNVPELVGGHRRIRLADRTNALWAMTNSRRFLRGHNARNCLNVPQPADKYDANGYPLPLEFGPEAGCYLRLDAEGNITGRGGTGDSCRREGYVMVTPWWGDAPIKVCAFDAQAIPTARNGQTCGSYYVNDTCGCGPNLQSCTPGPGNAYDQRLRRALEEEPARIFEHIVQEGLPYHQAFSTKTTFMNGPASHFYRHMTSPTNPLTNGGGIGFNSGIPTAALPPSDVENIDGWTPVVRDDMHAGILTTFLYNERFASNRGRANRFFSAFRCEPFLPSEDGLPAETHELPDPNLRTRAGCNSCHEKLEPIAAHWGRWRQVGEYGFLPTADFNFLEARADCMNCGPDQDRTNCSGYCNAYFITHQNAVHPDEIDQWLGMPRSRAWLQDDEMNILDSGPSLLVDEPNEQEKVASCAVRTLAEHLMGRELTEQELVEWVPSVTQEFADSGFQYNQMMRVLLNSDRYRTIR